jgi:GT2 family glycosyltransferase
VIVENGSPNESWERLRDWGIALSVPGGFSLRILKNDTNLGYGGGNNRGLRELFANLKCDVVFVVNSDVEIKAIELSDLCAIADDLPVCIGVRIRETTERPRTLYGGASFVPLLFRSQPALNRNSLTRGVFHVSGAFLGFNKALYQLSAGFDENLFLYFEELELFYRARRSGGAWPSVHIFEDWLVDHSLGGSTGNRRSGRKSPLTDYYSARARVLFARKHLKALLLNAVLYNVLLCTTRLGAGRVRGCITIMKGTLHGLLGRGGIYRPMHLATK